MTPGERMKHEMTHVELKRRGVVGIDAQMEALDATEKDRAEVRKFTGFLKDSKNMSLSELLDKHGADYLGFTPNEVSTIRKET